jgi:replicative DNA helicase
MSVDDLPYTADDAFQGGFERTPPQDIPAEQSVLGGMLLSKDAIAEVIEVIKAPDFYRPAHEMIFAAVLELYGRGEPADAVTVAALLTKKGDIARVGGAPYLHTLINSVPTAANAGYYAEIVKERAVLRRLVEAGTRIVQMGYQTDGSDVEQIVDAAQQEMYNVTDSRTSEDFVPLSAAMEGALDEIESISNRSGQMTGVPTGFHDLDALTNGLHPGQMVIIAARPAIGKALALDTPLPTPTGWTTMGDVQVGDLLLGADGKPTRVVAATEAMRDRPCYEVEFSDGSVIVADALHQWFTETRASRRLAETTSAAAGMAAGENERRPERTFGSVKTTEEIARTLRCATDDSELDHAALNHPVPNHSVPVAAAIELPKADLPMAPYALGVWLGTGHGRAARTGPATRGVLRALGVLGTKHIPVAYLRAAEGQRRALLAGLLDANGAVDSTGANTGASTVRYSVTNRRLAEGAHELILSLGYRATMTTKRIPGRSEADCTAYIVTFTPTDEVFRLTRKLARQTTPDQPATPNRPGAHHRHITDVRPITSVPVRCVEVDNADHLFLAGRGWIPTHNSTLGLDLARSCSIKHGLTSVLFSLEMGRNEIIMRLLSAEARVALHHMRSGTMTDEDWARLARRMGAVSEAPLFIDDSPNMSMMEIRAKARRLKQRHDLQLVIIDYMQLMQHGSSNSRRPDNRQQEVSEISRSLKLLAKELEVPVVAISQLNRGPEQRTDKRPMMSDLRESGSLEQDADVIILLHREDAYERESPRAGEADLIVAKHRNGPTANITVAFQGHYSRFVDMAQS